MFQQKNNANPKEKFVDAVKPNKMAKYVVYLLAILFLFFLVIRNLYVVNTGEVAIIKTFGKITAVQSEGLHFKIPFVQTKSLMEIREQAYSFGSIDSLDLEVSTKDMQSIRLELLVQANVSDPVTLYRAFAGKQEDRYIRPRTKEIVQSTIAKYTIEEFVSKRTEISQIIFADLKDDLEKYGMAVSNVSIVNHDFSDEYERAVEEKKVAEQSVDKAKAEQQKLFIEQENRVKLAELKLKEKELEAQANAIESNSLSDNLLRKMMIEKWNGELPKVNTSNDSSMILSPEILQ